jgi:hypothetical protein
MRTLTPAARLLVPALAVLVVAVVSTARPRAAEARPEFSRREGKDCRYCHVNPRGGGPRNPKGQEYERNGFTFRTAGSAPKGYGEDDAFTTEANGQAFWLARQAIALEHWGDALRRLLALQKKETKGPGAQLVVNTIGQVDGRGRDLARAAKEALAAGKAPEAAEALARLEAEFKGRDAAKEVPRIRAELQRLPDAKAAIATAVAVETQRLAFRDALMKDVEGDTPGAIAALEAFVHKYPDGPFAAEARAKAEELRRPPADPPAMGG